jgi:hypothetical protein
MGCYNSRIERCGRCRYFVVARSPPPAVQLDFHVHAGLSEEELRTWCVQVRAAVNEVFLGVKDVGESDHIYMPPAFDPTLLREHVFPTFLDSNFRDRAPVAGCQPVDSEVRAPRAHHPLCPALERGTRRLCRRHHAGSKRGVNHSARVLDRHWGPATALPQRSLSAG